MRVSIVKLREAGDEKQILPLSEVFVGVLLKFSAIVVSSQPELEQSKELGLGD